MREPDANARFEQAILPHLSAAFNLARWLTRADQDAEDVVQEAFLRALRFFPGYRGGDSRAWLLTIVRNTAYSWLERNRRYEPALPFDEELHSLPCDAANPEHILLERIHHETLRAAVEGLPVEFREVIVLRELEGLSYREIAEIVEVPLGTVMSRLARARQRLQKQLAEPAEPEIKR